MAIPKVHQYMNTNVLVTKISSKAVSIDHLTGCCKKCVNMGVAIPVRYILSKSIMAPTLRAASHTCALQTMHSILIFVLLPPLSNDKRMNLPQKSCKGWLWGSIKDILLHHISSGILLHLI